MKSRSLMSVGERIQADRARRAQALDRRETAEEDAHLRNLAAQGLRWHVGRTLWDLSELRACAPDCYHHSGSAA